MSQPPNTLEVFNYWCTVQTVIRSLPQAACSIFLNISQGIKHHQLDNESHRLPLYSARGFINMPFIPNTNVFTPENWHEYTDTSDPNRTETSKHKEDE